MRQLEDWEPATIKTTQGKTADVKTQLEHAEQQYRSTKKVYNLLSKKKTVIWKPGTHRSGRPRETKYTREQAEWLNQADRRQIAEQYQVTLTQAQAIRYYACRLYGLKPAK